MDETESFDKLMMLRDSLLIQITILESENNKTICQHIQLYRLRRRFTKLCAELTRRTYRRRSYPPLRQI